MSQVYSERWKVSNDETKVGYIELVMWLWLNAALGESKPVVTDLVKVLRVVADKT